MKKIIRIKDYYGVKEDIQIKEEFDIRKGDSVYVKYQILQVTNVKHDIEEETVYYTCEE